MDTTTTTTTTTTAHRPWTELSEWITIQRAEKMSALAREIASTWPASTKARVYRIAMRAVRARDRKMLTALERVAELVDARAEEQYGQTSRSPGSAYSESFRPTEAAMWREAYASADHGDPLRQLVNYYAAVAVYMGITRA